MGSTVCEKLFFPIDMALITSILHVESKYSLILFLLLASVFLLLGIFISCFIRYALTIKKKKVYKSWIVGYTIVFLLSIWCLRFSVAYFSILNPSSSDTLSFAEEVFNCLVHTFQTFSMDEDYTQYIIDGKRMIAAIFGDHNSLVVGYGVFASVINCLAPIWGGAILLQIIKSISEKAHFAFAKYTGWWKKMYFFSELNEMSLVAAESIIRKKEWNIFTKPILVFTDAYIVSDNEKSSELLIKAKSLGAICLQDDLSSLSLRFSHKKEYWLMDENELDNVKTLAELVNDEHARSYLKKTTINLFYQNDSYVMAENAIRQKIDKKFQNSKERPQVIRVNCYRNLAFSLLYEKPLFTPLLNKKDPKSLKITIFGNGIIGMEMFLSCTWCGQLFGIPLTIQMVSKDSLEDAVDKINQVSPEILESTIAGSPILKRFSDEQFRNIPNSANVSQFNDPYFTFQYAQINADIVNYQTLECVDWHNNDQKSGIMDSDYYIVALGADDINIRVADTLKRAIEREYFPEVTDSSCPVIAYVVYDSQLSKFLNMSKQENSHAEMVAIGSLKDVYSYSNIYLDKISSLAKKIRKAYDEASCGKKTKKEAQKGVEKKDIEDYNYHICSNRASAVHYKYKKFSAYCLKKRSGEEIDWKGWDFPNDIDETLKSHLAWLEKRRWNAYMRSCGFTNCEISDESKDKDLGIRVHGCLVEIKDEADGITALDCLDEKYPGNSNTKKEYDRRPLDKDIMKELNV